MLRKCFTLLMVTLAATVCGQKIPLGHDVYDGWKSISSTSVSPDGKWITWEITPQQGDGWLYMYNTDSRSADSSFCGTRPMISSESRYIVWQVKPGYGEMRDAKKKKLKDDQTPKNKMAYRLLPGGEINVVEKVRSYEVPESGSQWMAYLLEKKPVKKDEVKPSADTSKKSAAATRPAKKTSEPKGTELVIFNPVIPREFRFSDVTEYAVARNGGSVAFIQDFPDTTKVDNFRISCFDTKKEAVTILYEGKGSMKKLTSNRQGDKISFLFTSDTSKLKVYDLYLSLSGTTAQKIVDQANTSLPAGWSVSDNGSLTFSDDGTRLFFGTAPRPVKEPEDTLLADEKYKLDIWSWDDDLLQPMQKKQLDNELKKTYQAVYHIDRKMAVQLADTIVPAIRTMQKGNNDIALGSSDLKYRKLISWDASNYNDYYLVNVESGTRKLMLEKAPYRVLLSPSSKFLLYWDVADTQWISVSVQTGARKNITSAIKVPLYDELADTPSDPSPYGIEGWMDDEKHVIIADRYDLWSVDLNGSEAPVCLTRSYGRKNGITFRYQRLDPDADFVSMKETLYLTAFNNNNKQAGFFTAKYGGSGDPAKLIMGDRTYSGLTRAKKADRFLWRSGSFVSSPELYTAGINFSDAVRLSVTNPQQSKYNWGTAELVEWTSFDQSRLQGILYKPENFDPSRKYPMIVYFYERSSDGLNNYVAPAPSASTINRTFAVSNGYLVFVPDIPYRVGYPGESCYNAVISGTQALLENYDFIDRERLGLDGQSWGGYQIAYLVTRTDLFACAFSGAPVVNMISAYGGIRWESGMSRMFQYEQSQSRIGGTLWEKPLLFISNSPIFEIPKINTPLLIMHNDADGAVPWYQGIEFITALRRLDKPAWLLSYNDEGHNLTRRPNRKDLSVRKMQFFDHYLKNSPMPYWMKYGISQTEKGKTDGYELVNDQERAGGGNK